MIALPAPPIPDPRLLLGYSGGLDSSALLHLLAHSEWREALRVIHVHHGLHADADAWAVHCQQTCDALGVPLQIRHVTVARDAGLGREAAARQARHAAFADAMHDGEVLVLAHHRDDQAETFLLRALRGAGVEGLAAMRTWRDFHHGWMWRPLLQTSRAGLLDYARLHGLRWIDDPSNEDAALDRNFLRHDVLPLLRTRWPHAEAQFARSAMLAGEAAGLLDAEDAAALASVGTDDPRTLSVSSLLELPPARRARMLRRWIHALQLPPLPARGVTEIERMLGEMRNDAAPRFAWAGAHVRRWRDLLHADLDRSPAPATWRIEWDGSDALPLPHGDTLAVIGVEALPAPVIVHGRAGGERIRLPGRSHHHQLKHLLQERGVPPWVRERLPLLSAMDGRLLAAGDAIIDAELDAWLRERHARLQWTMA